MDELTVQTTYDALNRPVNITQPNNYATTNAYNKGGLLQQVKRGSTEYISNIDYNARGQRTKIVYGNGSETTFTYDEENFRLTRLLTTRNTGNDILQDLNYSYDSVGNIVEVEDDAQQTIYFNNTVIDPVSTYEYDALYRLVEATGRELTSLQMPTDTDFVNNIPVPNTGSNAMQTYTQQYSYDALGNITQMYSVNQWTRDYIYDTATNRLLRHSGSTNVYTYDAHGNMLSMPHLTSMVWTNRDELMEASNGTVTSYYQYDSQGNRTRKVVVKPGNIREERYYIGGYEMFYKYVGTTTYTKRDTVHVSEERDRFVVIDVLSINNGVLLTKPITTIRYQYSNHLGSAYLELDSAAATISYEEYHPFGTTSYRSGRNEVDVSLKRYKYVGKERDEETGLYYYGARYYAAWIARFVSVDPLQHKYLYYTPYQYAGNKPITYIDLDGLEEVKPEGKWGELKEQSKKQYNPKTYIFDESGNYTGKSFTSDTFRIAVKNTSTSEFYYFSLNDPLNDSIAIEKGSITKVRIVSSSEIINEVYYSGIYDNLENPIMYFEKESRPTGENSIIELLEEALFHPISYLDRLLREDYYPPEANSSGYLDFVSKTPFLIGNDQTLFIVVGAGSLKSDNLGTAYNKKDFGNFLWGATGRAANISLEILKTAAHVNNAFNSKKDNRDTKDFQPELLDSVEDQRAITNGYDYFTMIWERIKEKKFF